MAKTFKLGSIVVKLSRKSLTVTTVRAHRASASRKRSAQRRANFLQHKLNDVRYERQQLAETLEAAYGKIDSLTRELAERVRVAEVPTATVRKVKRSRSARVNAERAEVFMHRVTEE